MSTHPIATVAGVPVPPDALDAAEARLRTARGTAALPVSGTSEGRQLRRWLTQLIVTERVASPWAGRRSEPLLGDTDRPSVAVIDHDTVCGASLRLRAPTVSVVLRFGATTALVPVV